MNGKTLWTCGPGASSQLLCTWNAFALQTLGEAFVEADYTEVPRTRGYLPPVTAEQAAAFLGEVEAWSSRARRAGADPSYDLAGEIAVPAPLPGWVDVEPCPRPHLAATLSAARSCVIAPKPRRPTSFAAALPRTSRQRRPGWPE